MVFLTGENVSIPLNVFSELQSEKASLEIIVSHLHVLEASIQSEYPGAAVHWVGMRKQSTYMHHRIEILLSGVDETEEANDILEFLAYVLSSPSLEVPQGMQHFHQDAFRRGRNQASSASDNSQSSDEEEDQILQNRREENEVSSTSDSIQSSDEESESSETGSDFSSSLETFNPAKVNAYVTFPFSKHKVLSFNCHLGFTFNSA